MPRGKIYPPDTLDMCHHVWVLNEDPDITTRLANKELYSSTLQHDYMFRYRHHSRDTDRSKQFENWLKDWKAEVVAEGPRNGRRIRVKSDGKLLTYVFLMYKELK